MATVTADPFVHSRGPRGNPGRNASASQRRQRPPSLYRGASSRKNPGFEGRGRSSERSPSATVNDGKLWTAAVHNVRSVPQGRLIIVVDLSVVFSIVPIPVRCPIVLRRSF